MPEVLLKESIDSSNGICFRQGSRLFISREFCLRDGSQKFLQLAYANGHIVLNCVREEQILRVDPKPIV